MRNLTSPFGSPSTVHIFFLTPARSRWASEGFSLPRVGGSTFPFRPVRGGTTIAVGEVRHADAIRGTARQTDGNRVAVQPELPSSAAKGRREHGGTETGTTGVGAISPQAAFQPEVSFCALCALCALSRPFRFGIRVQPDRSLRPDVAPLRGAGPFPAFPWVPLAARRFTHGYFCSTATLSGTGAIVRSSATSSIPHRTKARVVRARLSQRAGWASVQRSGTLGTDAPYLPRLHQSFSSSGPFAPRYFGRGGDGRGWVGWQRDATLLGKR